MITLTLLSVDRLREPVHAENDVERLARKHDHVARPWLEDVLVGTHDVLRLPLCLFRKWHVHGHLVAVEVRVERVADERMELDGIAFDEARLKCLDALAMKCRGAIEKYVLAFDSFFEDFPHFSDTVFNETTSTTDVECEFAFKKSGNNEWTEEFKRHVLRKTALI